MSRERSSRADMLRGLADAVGAVTSGHPTRVAVDGPPASGKTTLADELAAVLRTKGRAVVRATIDDFLAPRAQRYRRGEYSGLGCYLDAHDHDALNRVLLDPLGPGGNRQVRLAVDEPTEPITVAADAVLIFDGVFLLRPELADRFELSIFVSTAPERTIDRAVAREGRAPAEVERRWRERYLPAQELYVAAVHPVDVADIVVHNDDPDRPLWEVRRTHGPVTPGPRDEG